MLDDKLITFKGEFLLEGLLGWDEEIPVRGGVVLAHPYPPHGATMTQPVIYRCAQACQKRGFATLRFNFRGVGNSEGTFDGREEYKDVESAAACLREWLDSRVASGGVSSDSSVRGGGKQKAVRSGSKTMNSHQEKDTLSEGNKLPLVVLGNSFGSVMSAIAAGNIKPDLLVLIGFVVKSDVVNTEGIDNLRGFPNPILAITGEKDEIAPPALARKQLEDFAVNYKFVVVPQADHFFSDCRKEVGEIAASFISDFF